MHVDTGIMIELLRRSRRDPLVRTILDLLEGERLFWSTLQFGELADSCRRSGEDVALHVRRVADLVEEILVDRDIAVLGSELKAEARRRGPQSDFGLADGIILATARTLGEDLLTMDPDFEGFTGVRFVVDVE